MARFRGWKVWLLVAVVAVTAAVALNGCGQVKVPSGCTVVTGFELDRYLGEWYEIARFDNEFERGLTHVTARYEKRPDGRVTVNNRGYRPLSQTWEDARGVAAFVGSPTEGFLKVSFFGPFWAGYNIIALDAKDYQWSMVVGPSRKYLWILSRQRTLDPKVKAALLAQARGLGFDVDKLVNVVQDEPVPSAAPSP